MSDILHTAFDAAEILAATGDTEYRSVELVYARNGTGDIVPYCRREDWHATPVAVLATKDAQIAALQNEVARLRAELEAASLTTEDAEDRIADAIRQVRANRHVSGPARYQPQACPLCPESKPFMTLNGWKAHMRIKHKMTGVEPGDVVEEETP